MATSSHRIYDNGLLSPLPLPQHSSTHSTTDAQFHLKDRAIHRTLLNLSLLIDQLDAVQQRSKNVFTGWEHLCEIFVSRDDPLLFVVAMKDKRQARRRESNYKGGEESPSSSESDSDDAIHDTPIIAVEKLDKKDRKTSFIKRPASTTHSLPQLPSPTPSPPSTSSSFGSSGKQKTEDEGKRDFLPRIHSKHCPSDKKERDTISSHGSRSLQKSTGTMDQPGRLQEPAPARLQMYSAVMTYDPTSAPSKHSESTRTTSTPEPSPSPSRLQMYYPRSNTRQMYISTTSNASKNL